MADKHDFMAKVIWTGNRGTGTSAYNAYDRTWDLGGHGKPVLRCSNDPVLGGDPALYNPEELLIAALSSCHMLWYLHLCSNAQIVVTAYEDEPIGIGESEPSGKGRFVEAILRPSVTIREGDHGKALTIHEEIHEYCFIARSVNFPVKIEPRLQSDQTASA